MSGVVCYPSAGRRKALKICRAFAAGCAGRVAAPGQTWLEDGAAFFYGWTGHTRPLMDRCIAEGRPWFYADNGYFGRGAYFRVTRGALMHDGRGEAGPERFAATGLKIAPWRRDGAHILVAAQSEAFYRERLDTTRAAWVAAVRRELRRHSDRPILVCEKPRPRAAAPQNPFGAALSGAWAVVGHSSNCLVEALIAGVPVFPLGPCAATVMGRSELAMIERPLRPQGRRQWLWNLAANQWTREEMADGTCWDQMSGIGEQGSGNRDQELMKSV